MDIEMIRTYLPHGYPFLLIDKVLQVEKDNIVCLKNVSANEPYFMGHFPDKSIMPGVLQLEAIAQSGCILMVHKFGWKKNEYDVFLNQIKNGRFRRMVVPGDQLILKVHLYKYRKNIAFMIGKGYVNDELAVECDASATFVPKNSTT